MALASELFLTSFNRIEKWMREKLDDPSNMGFSEMVRRLAKKEDLQVKNFEDDLLQFAQLRNAIVHEKISQDFVIAEPNQWSVNKITDIEKELISPEKVIPRFRKKVTGFEMDLPLRRILKIVAEKEYSQFPIYHKGKFEALLTVHGIGLWFSKEFVKGTLSVEDKQVKDILSVDRKWDRYQFVASDTPIFVVKEMFHSKGKLETVLITENGDPDGNLVGIIRSRDLFA